MAELKEGKGGADVSMHPAALHHEHSKSHMVGKAFSASHGKSHDGCLGGATETQSAPASVNAPQSAGDPGSF
jgi:hypothetical protein